MAEYSLPALRAVARALGPLDIRFVFAGGSILGYLVNHPEVVPLRPTDDVDVIVEVFTYKQYGGVEEHLRQLGFDHDMREGAPMCRWVYRNLTVDIMPVEGDFLGLNTQYFREALDSAMTVDSTDPPFKVLSHAGFLATKLLAFRDRGAGDFLASHDLEDIITVMDGRAEILGDVTNSHEPLRTFIAQSFRQLLDEHRFRESIPGHLPPDRAS